jgi:Domain of unknown function (DUF4382)
VTDYHYPFWRRGVFAALFIVVLALALVPPVAKGTVNVHVFTISTPGSILHFYVTVSQMELHSAGLPSAIGWVSISYADNPLKLDLAGQNGQSSQGASITSSVQSGRYDQVRISIQQSSLTFVGGNLTRSVCSSCLSQLLFNATLPIPPNGYGTLLLVLSPDYESLLDLTPTFALNVVQVSTP